MSTNPYMGNPFVSLLGAASQGIAIGQQQRKAEALQQAAQQRQAMLDRAKAGLDTAQAGNYDASAYESRKRGDSYDVTAGNALKDKLAGHLHDLYTSMPDLLAGAATRGQEGAWALQQAKADYANTFAHLYGNLPQGAPPSGIPTGGNSGNLGMPSNPAQMGSGTLGMGPFASNGSGDLGGPPPGIPLRPFGEQLQQQAAPRPFSAGAQFGIPTPSPQPAYQPRVGVPQGMQAGPPPNIPQAPQMAPQGAPNMSVPYSPDENLKNAQTAEANARTQQIKATIGDPVPFLSEIGKYTQPGAQAIFTQQWNESHGTHFGVPGVNFQGTYSLNTDEALKQLETQTKIHNDNLKGITDQAKVRGELAIGKQNADTAAAAQRALEAHQGKQDTLGQGNLDLRNKNDPESQRRITSYTSQIQGLQTAIDKANSTQTAAVANTTLTPKARQMILQTQDAIKLDALNKQQALKDKIDQMGTQQSSSSYTGGGSQAFQDVYQMAKSMGDPHPEVAAAQAILESNGGAHVGAPNNLFGIKGNGPSAPTKEFVNGRMVNTIANWRSYASPNTAVADRLQFLKNPRYGGYWTAKDTSGAVQALARGGYATDPAYAQKLIAIIKSNSQSGRGATQTASAKIPSQGALKTGIKYKFVGQ